MESSDHYDPIPDYYSPELRSLISSCLSFRPEARPSVVNLLRYAQKYVLSTEIPKSANLTQGYSIGDFLALGQLCWKVYKKCKDSPGKYAELSSKVGALHNVMKETEELLSQQDLTTEQKAELVTWRQACEGELKDLDGFLVKYESLGTNS